jgi:hypothetical protein
VEENAKNGDARPLTDRQQRLLLRAVVGSLVLSAALASNASAQQKVGVLGGSPAAAQESPRAVPRVYAVPFRDLLVKIRRMVRDGQLKADDVFEFTVEAERNADGSLRDVRFTGQAAVNGRWRNLAEEFVTVLSDSRALSYLEGVERVTFTVGLAERLTASLVAEAPTEEAAAQLGQTSALFLDIARHSQQGRPGVELLKGMRASAGGKRFSITLDMTRAEVGNLLSQTSAIP